MRNGRERRLLFLIDKLTYGGAQTVLWNIAENLDRRYKVYVVALFAGGEVSEKLKEINVPTECLFMQSPFSLKGYIEYAPQFTSFIKNNKIDLVHSFLNASGFYGGIAAWRAKIPSILNAHGPLSRGKVKIMEVMSRNINDYLVAINDMTLREAKRTRMWGSRSRVKLIYNGITPLKKIAIKKVKKETIRLTMVANFFPEKDHATLIEAFEVLQKQGNLSLELRIVGDGEERFKADVIRYVKERNINNITFCGSLGLEEITEIMAQTDIFVLSSHSEGLSISATEAMSVGVPVIASDVGAMRELIDHRKDGVLVPPRSVEKLAGVIEELSLDRVLREDIGRRAIGKVETKFSLGKMIDEYQNLYSSCLD